MKSLYLTAALAPLLFALPSHAQTTQPEARPTAWEASRVRANDDMVATGVARARDRLDSATSTSSISTSEIVKINPTSLSDLLRTVPGIRAEAGAGEGNGSYTVRGLPLVGGGAKYLQLQEDGLPVLQFGDILSLTPDIFLRADFNVGQIESIRGGSSSTFASNAPGGVINLISNTGEVEGGSVQFSTGLNYETYRADFSAGGHLSDTLRYHIGGFYREGEGLRDTGFNGNGGGQIKFNVTKEFDGGFLRLEGKWLDDTYTQYAIVPLAVSGTNDDPNYSSINNFPVTTSTLYSNASVVLPYLNGDNELTRSRPQDGTHVQARSIGFQSRFNVLGWNIAQHMRYSEHSGSIRTNYPLAILPATAATGAVPGRLVYAAGPQTGQTITNLTGLNGNGLVSSNIVANRDIQSLNNFASDIRASRVWNVASGELTGTFGIYNARQDVDFDRQYMPYLSDVVGGGNVAPIDIVNLNGTPRTQGGVSAFSGIGGANSSQENEVTYDIFAPYASMNYRQGKLAVGASVRLETGKAEGFFYNGLTTDVRAIDANGDGVISTLEQRFSTTPRAAPVDYDYDYVSYSISANYRISQSLSTFARYSEGGRAAADKIVGTAALNPAGGLVNDSSSYDPVTQAEGGFKFRSGGLFANLTGFWAEVSETNTQIKPDATGATTIVLVTRGYSAYGAEFEGGIRRGPFSLTAGATATEAEILEAEDATLVGGIPRRQPKVIFQLMPQYDTDLFTIGASVVGTTSSYTQDTNRLRMPGYTTVNAFLQVRPIDRVVVSLNANNLFDTMAITEVSAATMPASGFLFAQTLPGRNISAAVRFYF
ncbi:TonB-dependent receptor domain-containing protein [Brevundimonas sp.]|uniref:TonB-dependent receptor domain-containing protein n=1 Tax=Brevundimonas sp. TaxID=1871086 RepID=UPI00286AC571|nr:TonB-dependent receptor [Brevundimonas sp.]